LHLRSVFNVAYINYTEESEKVIGSYISSLSISWMVTVEGRKKL